VLYADDTTILLSSKSLNILNINAHKALADYVEWFSSCQLALNQKKSHFVLFSKPSLPNTTLPCLKTDYCTISRVNQTKFLGLLIDEKLNWNYHCNSIRDKLSKGVAMLKLSSYFMPRECLLHIYNAFMLSYLSYCNVVWGNAHKKYLNPLLILQKRAIRLICNCQPLSHCATLAKQCSILFVFDLYKYHVLKYMHVKNIIQTLAVCTQFCVHVRRILLFVSDSPYLDL
jgi:hypothetical protein